MKNILILTLFSLLFIQCGKEDLAAPEGESDNTELGSFSDSSVGGGDKGSSSGNGNSTDPGDPSNDGLLTAGEWNDLENWDYWTELVEKEIYEENTKEYITNALHRVSVRIENPSGANVVNAVVSLYQEEDLLWTSMTDTKGNAELFAFPFPPAKDPDWSAIHIRVNGTRINVPIKPYDGQQIIVNSNSTPSPEKSVDLAFVVDATGSMGDEIEFLKDDLTSVIEKIQVANSSFDVRTGAVFYRDLEDEYVTKKSDFSRTVGVTQSFIDDQSAAGGGDFPEAVELGLKEMVEQLSWNENSTLKVAFLILDAPPHLQQENTYELENAIKASAEKGIKIIPITASGIDKATEFLMRNTAILTNAPYVFITDDSGIGNDHIEPTIGDYEVEFLNDLMVRVVGEYLE